ncbi:hypothetical protein BKA80DRAFT_267188 [Phyllosticta citrichinensis]
MHAIHAHSHSHGRLRRHQKPSSALLHQHSFLLCSHPRSHGHPDHQAIPNIHQAPALHLADASPWRSCLSERPTHTSDMLLLARLTPPTSAVFRRKCAIVALHSCDPSVLTPWFRLSGPACPGLCAAHDFILHPWRAFDSSSGSTVDMPVHPTR